MSGRGRGRAAVSVESSKRCEKCYRLPSGFALDLLAAYRVSRPPICLAREELASRRRTRLACSRRMVRVRTPCRSYSPKGGCVLDDDPRPTGSGSAVPWPAKEADPGRTTRGRKAIRPGQTSSGGSRASLGRRPALEHRAPRRRPTAGRIRPAGSEQLGLARVGSQSPHLLRGGSCLARRVAKVHDDVCVFHDARVVDSGVRGDDHHTVVGGRSERD